MTQTQPEVREAPESRETLLEIEGLSKAFGTVRANQDISLRVDRGEIVGTPTRESADLRAARKRIRELESELAIIRQASKFFAEDKPHPKGFTR